MCPVELYKLVHESSVEGCGLALLQISSEEIYGMTPAFENETIHHWF